MQSKTFEDHLTKLLGQGRQHNQILHAYIMAGTQSEAAHVFYGGDGFSNAGPLRPWVP